MTDHLRECEMASPQCAGRASGETHRGVMFCLHCQRRCICTALRACERRVLDSAVQRVIELPDLLDAGFTYSGLLRREAVIEALKKKP